MIKFEDASTLGRGSFISVKRLFKIPPSHSKYRVGAENRVWLVKGRISKSPYGYAYYEPDTNELNPSFRDDDLEKLKEKVERHLKL